jgi:hypothetical protein
MLKDVTQDVLDKHESFWIETNDYYLLALELNPIFRESIQRIFGKHAFAMIAPHLFEPVPILQGMIDKYLPMFGKGKRVIGMHIRTKRFSIQSNPNTYFRYKLKL